MRRRAAAFLAAAGLACGGAARSTAPSGPTCRDVARRGQTLLADPATTDADGAVRFLAGVIDLCQAPGLSPATRACLAGATNLAAARGCPSLALPGERGGPEPAASCREVVEHAMGLVDADADVRPTDASDRRSQRESYVEDCARLDRAGRRCAAAAATVDALDDCLDDPANAKPEAQPPP